MSEPRLIDVAKRAGVSVGTVSRVINRVPEVTPELRTRVEAAIDQLGYRPNALARSFRRQRSSTLGLVIPDVTAPFFAELAKHIEAAALKLNYTLLLGNAMYSPELERVYLNTLADRRVDGLIIVPSTSVNPVSSREQAKVVVVDRELSGMDIVSSDHRGGAVAAVEYLLELGHTLIACIAGAQDLPPLRERYHGYFDTVAPVFAEHGVEVQSFVRIGPWDYQFGYEAAQSLLGESSPRPTAIFCSSDQQAIGVLRACADLGLNVPRDLSIIGYDDIPLADLVMPRLTTVRQPIEAIARHALDQLVSRLAAPGKRRRRIFLPTELVVRASCAAPQRRPARSAGKRPVTPAKMQRQGVRPT